MQELWVRLYAVTVQPLWDGIWTVVREHKFLSWKDSRYKIKRIKNVDASFEVPEASPGGFLCLGGVASFLWSPLAQQEPVEFLGQGHQDWRL